MKTFRKYFPQFLIPKTLWGQLVSLLLLALFFSQVIALGIFVDTRRIYENNASEEVFLNRIVTTVKQISNTGRKFAPHIARDASTRDIKLRFAPKPFSGKDTRPDYSQKFHKKLVDELEDESHKINVVSTGSRQVGLFRHRRPEEVQVSVQLGQRIWLRATYKPRKPPSNALMPLFVTMILMMLSMILVVSLVVRRLTKPLGALARAAQDLGHGRDVQELAEEGSEDVRKVTRSFNQMNQKLKRFVDDRTKMLAAISHDLRTPITSLRLRAEFIDDKEMKVKIIETLDEMQQMTDAALKFAKDSTSQEKTKDIDLASLLDSLTSDYTDMQEDVSLNIDPKQYQIILPIRVVSIKRALRNLIDNGLKYGNAVTMNFAINGAENMVEIYIRDKGKGIAVDELDQVFEPFYRLEKSRNKSTGGVGLGLSIARNIVRAHGGDVVLENIKQDGKITGLEAMVSIPI